MGMFDWVNYSCDCPVCGELVEGFQSKDSHCLLDNLNPTDVDNFYTSCDGCGSWIELNSQLRRTGSAIYEMTANSSYPRQRNILAREDITFPIEIVYCDCPVGKCLGGDIQRCAVQQTKNHFMNDYGADK
jgi:hypothetical protein